MMEKTGRSNESQMLKNKKPSVFHYVQNNYKSAN